MFIKFTKTITSLDPSPIQKALKDISNQDTISFSLGMPCRELFPIAQYKATALDTYLPLTLQYSPPPQRLKEQIATLMKYRGVRTSANNIFLTTGAQQAINLLLKALTYANDTIVTDPVIYPGFIQAAECININIKTASLDDQKDGDSLSLEKLFSYPKKPKLIYTMSDGHNPLGRSLSRDERLHLIHTAHRFRIPILEDDAYGLLAYEKTEPPLYSLNSEGIIYIGSFSKILGPSLRVGWIIAPEPLISKLEILKESSDINTSTLSQHILSNLLDQNFFSDYLSLACQTYRDKRDKMVECLTQYIPDGKFFMPSSGFFIWLKLPDRVSADKLFYHAIKDYKVSFLPGNAFSACSEDFFDNYIRLSFSSNQIKEIEEGIIRLSKAIKSMKCN